MSKATQFPRKYYGIPVTIQATEETLKTELPHASWLPDYALIVEGRQIGYAVRETGEDYVFVRFPLVDYLGAASTTSLVAQQQQFHRNTTTTSSGVAESSSTSNVAVVGGGSGEQQQQNKNINTAATTSPCPLTSISFTVPKRYLVPVPCSKGTPSINVLAQQQHQRQQQQQAASSPSATSTFGNNNNNFPSSQVHLEIRSDGRPIMCVVCGAWDGSGDFRKSGYKCGRCIGVKSVSRLKEIYSRIAGEGISMAPTVEIPCSSSSSSSSNSNKTNSVQNATATTTPTTNQEKFRNHVAAPCICVNSVLNKTAPQVMMMMMLGTNNMSESQNSNTSNLSDPPAPPQVLKSNYISGVTSAQLGRVHSPGNQQQPQKSNGDTDSSNASSQNSGTGNTGNNNNKTPQYEQAPSPIHPEQPKSNVDSIVIAKS